MILQIFSPISYWNDGILLNVLLIVIYRCYFNWSEYYYCTYNQLYHWFISTLETDNTLWCTWRFEEQYYSNIDLYVCKIDETCFSDYWTMEQWRYEIVYWYCFQTLKYYLTKYSYHLLCITYFYTINIRDIAMQSLN